VSDKERCRRYRAKHPERRKASQKKYRESLKAKAVLEAWRDEDKKENHDKWAKRWSADRAKYRDRLRIATLDGYTPFGLINSFYPLVKKLTKETGIKHSIDHIVPLKGDSVCGLNVPWNIQIIPLSENMKKGNKPGGVPFP